MLVRVIPYTFTDPRIPGAGEQVYRLVTTLLDPFAYPAQEMAVLYHERWHVELVIDEARTHLRLSARTLRSLTPEGVIQEIYALVLAHLVVRTLMLQAAEQAQIAPTQISFTETIRIMADPTATPDNLVQPGHVFPLRARPGGVLQRAGHTEAAVDLVKLAGEIGAKLFHTQQSRPRADDRHGVNR